MSNINFKIFFNNKRNPLVTEKAPCYYNVFHADCTKVKKVLCYQNDIHYTEDEIIKWIKYINDWGFVVKYLGESNIEGKEGLYHQFEIPVAGTYTDKRMLGSAFMLLRYLYEFGVISTFPKKFFSCMEELEDEDSFEVMQYVHQLLPEGCNTNHMLRYTKPMSLLSRKEVEDIIKKKPCSLSQTSNYNINGFWQGIMGTANEQKNISKLSTKEQFKYYKHLSLNIYVVGGHTNYCKWIPKYTIVDSIKKADLVMFTGGEDVDPSLYGEPKGKYTGSNLKRDLYEKDIFEQCRKLGKQMIGICRGSQFLCVMAGGKLVQHQKNPAFIHEMITPHGTINITSTHHQAQFPYNLNYREYSIIGWTNKASDIHLDGEGKELSPSREVEICQYYNINALAIQGHPEIEEYYNNPKHKYSIDIILTIFNDFIQIYNKH